MKKVIKLNEGDLKKIISESVKSVLKEYVEADTDTLFNYVVKGFKKEGIEIGDAGDAEELYQGCSNYSYSDVPIEQLYQKIKEDWLLYKSEQGQYNG